MRHRIDGPAVLVGPQLAFAFRKTFKSMHRAARDAGAALPRAAVEQAAELAKLAADVEAGRVPYDGNVSSDVSDEIAASAGSVTVSSQWMSTAAVAARLGCTHQNVRALMGRGTLRARRDDRGRWWAHQDDVDELVDRRDS